MALGGRAHPGAGGIPALNSVIPRKDDTYDKFVAEVPEDGQEEFDEWG